MEIIQALSALFIPDVLLICSAHITSNLKDQLDLALKATALPFFPEVAIRETDQLITLGMATAMRLHWLEEMHLDAQRLRPGISSAQP